MDANIKNFLDKFRSIIGNEDLFRNDLIKIIQEETKIEIKKEDLTYKNGIIRIKGDNYIKIEILMQKDAILSRLKALYLKKDFKDIV